MAFRNGAGGGGSRRVSPILSLLDPALVSHGLGCAAVCDIDWFFGNGWTIRRTIVMPPPPDPGARQLCRLYLAVPDDGLVPLCDPRMESTEWGSAARMARVCHLHGHSGGSRPGLPHLVGNAGPAVDPILAYFPSIGR